MKMREMTDRLDGAVRDAFENGQMGIRLVDGVFWIVRTISLASENGRKDHMKVRAVGLPKEGLKRLTASVERIASEF